MSFKESILWLIDAEDKATAKVRKSAEEVEKLEKEVKAAGKASKTSAGHMAELAGILGGAEVGQFANEIKGLTDKVADFTEATKAGGLGALAFKAGLIAATAAISFKVGTVISEWILQFTSFREEFKETLELMDSVSEKSLAAVGKTFERQKTRIGFIIDPDEQAEAIREFAAKAERELKGVETQLENAKAKFEADDTFVNNRFFAADLELTKKNIQQAEQLLEVRKSEAKVAAQMAESAMLEGEHRKELEAIAATNKEFDDAMKHVDLVASLEKQATETINQERLKAREEEEKAAIDAMDKEFQAAIKHVDLVASLEKQATETINRERRQAQDKQEAAEKRIADLKQSTLDKLKLEVVTMQQGAEAARALELQMQGVDEATAKQLAHLEAGVDVEKKKASVKADLTTSNERLLSGKGASAGNKLFAETKKTADETKKQTDILESIDAGIEALTEAPGNEFVEVG